MCRSDLKHFYGSAIKNAAFSLRGLTSGALLGGLTLAIFWKKGRAFSVITGMLISLAVMTAIQPFPAWEVTKGFWAKAIGTEIYWPWYTLIRLLVTLAAAWVTERVFAQKS